MTELPPKPQHHGGTGEMQRTVILYLILGVMGWVGYSTNQQNITQAKMQTQFEDMQQSLKPLTEAMPTVSRELDKHELMLSDHERRITDLEQLKGLHR